MGDVGVVTVAKLRTLGDNYKVLIESLSRIAEAGLTLGIVGR